VSRNHYSLWFGGEHEPWDTASDGPFRFVDLRYWSLVFREVDRLAPDSGLHVLATDALSGPLPVSGSDVVVLCLNDELGRTPTYAFDVRLVVKTMGAGRRAPYVALWPPRRWAAAAPVAAQELIVQLRRLPFLVRAAVGTVRHRRRPPLLDVPLGLRAYHDRPVTDFDERTYDVMFAGSLVNQPGEEKRWPVTQKVRFRRDFLAALSETQRARPDVRFSVRTVPSHWSALQAMGAYISELLDSRIVLCPRGSSLDTHRYFEALRAGCVPVYEVLPHRPYYDGSPAVRCRDWTQLPAVLDDLLGDPTALHRRHESAVEWYRKHVAPEAVAATIAGRLGRD
jgi:hypothetical protein